MSAHRRAVHCDYQQVRSWILAALDEHESIGISELLARLYVRAGGCILVGDEARLTVHGLRGLLAQLQRRREIVVILPANGQASRARYCRQQARAS